MSGPSARSRAGTGALALKDVTSSYGPGPASVLDEVSLRLSPGARVALTGASGSGKTAPADVLVRFRDPIEVESSSTASTSGSDPR
jgi:ABC-type multidrug transport system fused ATPase/permease subunit